MAPIGVPFKVSDGNENDDCADFFGATGMMDMSLLYIFKLKLKDQLSQ